MKNTLIVVGVGILILLGLMYKSSKSPAAENRDLMDRNAKRTSDSIKHWLDSALNDPAKELGGMPYGNQQSAAAATTNTTAANTTSKTVDHK